VEKKLSQAQVSGDGAARISGRARGSQKPRGRQAGGKAKGSAGQLEGKRASTPDLVGTTSSGTGATPETSQRQPNQRSRGSALEGRASLSGVGTANSDPGGGAGTGEGWRSSRDGETAWLSTGAMQGLPAASSEPPARKNLSFEPLPTPAAEAAQAVKLIKSDTQKALPGSAKAPPVPDETDELPPPKHVGSGRFRLDERLGSGCFGEVWRAADLKRNSNEVAVKLEVKEDSVVPGQLANEYEILSELKRPMQQQGFAEVFHFGREGHFVCLVMELLGKSLDDCLDLCNGRFNVKTTALIAAQIIQRIEYLHSKRIIHRDIKPENFMMGVGARAHIVYLIDFGLSEVYYLDDRHNSQVKDTLTGTARYASINAHDHSQSRRDDLEAIGHMLIYFLRGSLPWSGLKAALSKGEDELLLIRDTKKVVKLSMLCEGMPQEFEDYLEYCRALSYRERPDYEFLHELFNTVRWRIGPVQVHELQWLQGIQPETLVQLTGAKNFTQPDDGQSDGFFPCCKKRRAKPRRRNRGAPDSYLGPPEAALEAGQGREAAKLLGKPRSLE